MSFRQRQAGGADQGYFASEHKNTQSKVWMTFDVFETTTSSGWTVESQVLSRFRLQRGSQQFTVSYN